MARATSNTVYKYYDIVLTENWMNGLDTSGQDEGWTYIF